MPPLNKPLPQATLRELLEAVQDLEVRDAAQVLGAAARDFGLPIFFTAAPGSDVSDREGRRVGVVREEWLGELFAGRAFAGRKQITAAAGQLGKVQLFNPAGSGVRVRLYRLAAAGAPTGAFRVYVHAAALSAAPSQGMNLLSIGAPSVAELHVVSGAGPVGGAVPFAQVAPAGVESVGDLFPPWLIDLAPGLGAHVESQTVAAATDASYFWTEGPA